ncbi:hypothetical protein [Clostridium massiliamazoniense]|uniref:hypothetical protein n=1 Tax=Clostridium massiliamazoniense TaxID=1347366 RepID=UPI0006D79C19|nr:hypothetical protein [Clostridium massiliamazoniense]
MNRLKINGIILALLATLSIGTFLVSCGNDEKVNNTKELVNKAKEANYKKEVSLSVLSDTDKNTVLLTVKNGEVTHDITKK